MQGEEVRQIVDEFLDLCHICGEPHNGESSITIFGPFLYCHQRCYDGLRDNDPAVVGKHTTWIRGLLARMDAVTD